LWKCLLINVDMLWCGALYCASHCMTYCASHCASHCTSHCAIDRVIMYETCSFITKWETLLCEEKIYYHVTTQCSILKYILKCTLKYILRYTFIYKLKHVESINRRANNSWSNGKNSKIRKIKLCSKCTPKYITHDMDISI